MFLSGLSASYLLIMTTYAFLKDLSLVKGELWAYFAGGITAFILSLSMFGFCLWIDKFSFFSIPSYQIKPLLDDWIPFWVGGILTSAVFVFGYTSHWQSPILVGGLILLIVMIAGVYLYTNR